MKCVRNAEQMLFFFSIEKIYDVPQEIIQPHAFIFRNEKTKLTVGLKDWPKIMVSDETEI